MVAVIFGVLKTVPVPRRFPPDAASYQLTVPALGVAVSVNVPPVQLVEPVPVIVGTVLMVAVTAVLVADTHPLNASA